MKLWKLLPLGMAFIFSSSTLCAQIKPTAMLLPIYFVDLDKKSLQGSLNNFVKTELSNYYDLKSEKEVEQARDAAVDQISSENCTEEACVKVMGELLDVEYTFSLEIIDTGEGWDLSVVRQDMDGVTSRRNELCNECSLSKARKSLAGILTALRPGEMLIQRGKASLRLESTPRSQVFLDGREQGKTPLDLSVNARVPLEIFMVAEGYNDFAEEFTLKPGEKRKKHAKLTRKRGNIHITSNPPKASIYVDGVLEMDAQDKALLTPADLRLVYGQHELKLELEKYEVATETLRINKKNIGIKNITLIPKPGRLIVRVPSEHKQARIMLDDNYFGSMNGSIVKNFEVPANVRHSLRAEDGDFTSETKTIRIEPDGSEKVEFENFTETKTTPFKLPDWSGADLSL
ncbi:MAG: PEGA domain-containing protein, partial [SAR324 cluster bacterium]|nr:PEGA domain-containing protein [SAR324 cluster bacterium]